MFKCLRGIKKKFFFLTFKLKPQLPSECGPHISAHAFPLDGELDFYLKMIYLLENNLESPLIFVLFFKGKTK